MDGSEDPSALLDSTDTRETTVINPKDVQESAEQRCMSESSLSNVATKKRGRGRPKKAETAKDPRLCTILRIQMRISEGRPELTPANATNEQRTPMRKTLSRRAKESCVNYADGEGIERNNTSAKKQLKTLKRRKNNGSEDDDSGEEMEWCQSKFARLEKNVCTPLRQSLPRSAKDKRLNFDLDGDTAFSPLFLMTRGSKSEQCSSSRKLTWAQPLENVKEIEPRGESPAPIASEEYMQRPILAAATPSILKKLRTVDDQRRDISNGRNEERDPENLKEEQTRNHEEDNHMVGGDQHDKDEDENIGEVAVHMSRDEKEEGDDAGQEEQNLEEAHGEDDQRNRDCNQNVKESERVSGYNGERLSIRSPYGGVNGYQGEKEGVEYGQKMKIAVNDEQVKDIEDSCDEVNSEDNEKEEEEGHTCYMDMEEGEEVNIEEYLRMRNANGGLLRE